MKLKRSQAAKIAGCKQIVAVDKVKSRLDMAKSFGATDALDTTGVEDLEAKFKEVTGGLGPTVVVDSKLLHFQLSANNILLTSHTATGFAPVFEAGYKTLGPRGKFVFIGVVPDQEYALKIDPRTHMMNGSMLLGCCEGDSLPHEVSTLVIRTVTLC